MNYFPRSTSFEKHIFSSHECSLATIANGYLFLDALLRLGVALQALAASLYFPILPATYNKYLPNFDARRLLLLFRLGMAPSLITLSVTNILLGLQQSVIFLHLRPFFLHAGFVGLLLLLSVSVSP